MNTIAQTSLFRGHKKQHYFSGTIDIHQMETILTNDWPFMGRNLLRNHIHEVADSMAVLIAKEYNAEQVSWENSRQILGRHYIETNQLELAEMEYRALTKMIPDDVKIRLQLGRLLRMQSRYEAAMSEIIKANRIQPDFAPTLLEMGIVLHKNQNTQAAIQVLHRAMQLDRKRPEFTLQQRLDAYYTLAEAYYLQGNRSLAKKLLEDLLRQVPNYEQARHLLRKIETNLSN